MTDETAALAFADQVGRHFSKRYGMPPITGRVLGWLMVCDPPEQTAAELSEVLQASRSAISSAVATLEGVSQVQRTRSAGERVDRIRIHPQIWQMTIETPGEYDEFAAITRRGLAALSDLPPHRLARLTEAAAFAELLAERIPAFAAEWQERLVELRASGEVPDNS